MLVHDFWRSDQYRDCTWLHDSVTDNGPRRTKVSQHCMLTLSFTNFRLFQIERVCRRQFRIWWQWQKVLLTGRKHCGKRRNCSFWAISPFPTVFSKDLHCRHVKARVCLGRVNIHVHGVQYGFQHYYSYVAMASAPIHAAMESGVRGSNPVALTIINLLKERLAEPEIEPPTSCSQDLYATDWATLVSTLGLCNPVYNSESMKSPH